jgi:hypothetical protein
MKNKEDMEALLKQADELKRIKEARKQATERYIERRGLVSVKVKKDAWSSLKAHCVKNGYSLLDGFSLAVQKLIGSNEPIPSSSLASEEKSNPAKRKEGNQPLSSAERVRRSKERQKVALKLIAEGLGDDSILEQVEGIKAETLSRLRAKDGV